MEGEKMSEAMFRNIMSDPFYCLSQVAEHYGMPHPPMVTKEEWIKVGVKMIEEDGAENYLRRLLHNLSGGDQNADPEK